MRAAAAAKELTQINDGISVECARSPDRLLPFRSLICFSVYNCIRLVAYLFIAGKVFPHWNRRTGTHGNHCHQYTDRNQIDHFPAAFFFSFNVYLFFIVRLNNDSRFAFLSLLLKHSLSLLNSFFFSSSLFAVFPSIVFWFSVHSFMHNFEMFISYLFGWMHFKKKTNF